MSDRYETLRQALNRLRLQILTTGPITLYDAHKALVEKYDGKLALPTVDRHIRILRSEREIVVYRRERHRSGQIKKFYGPTFYGFLRSFRIEGGFMFKNFKSILERWFEEEKFPFFMPKADTLAALNDERTGRSLARLCQLVANMFDLAEDMLYEFGYDKPDPGRIVQLSEQLAFAAYDRRFVDTCKTLCQNVPAFGSQVRQLIATQRENLDAIEQEFFGKLAPSGQK